MQYAIYDSEIRIVIKQILKYKAHIFKDLLDDNPDFGIEIVAYSGYDDCDSEPQRPEDGQPPQIHNVWGKDIDIDHLQLPCNVQFQTEVTIFQSALQRSNIGIYATGTGVVGAAECKLRRNNSYDAKLENHIISKFQNCDFSGDSYSRPKYACVKIDNPLTVTLHGNEIQNSQQIGIDICNKPIIGVQCDSNYIHDNGFANVKIQDSYPYLTPLRQNENVPKSPYMERISNKLVGASYGIYVLYKQADFDILPWIFHNSIEHYLKCGVYAGNETEPVLQSYDRDGNNSICEGASPTAWNFYREYYMPISELWAENNWWGSADEHDFNISGGVDYDPWLRNGPPFPDGFLGKTLGNNDLLPRSITITTSYPNPFNSNIIFKSYLPEAGHVTGKIYNMLGQQVTTILDDYLPAGENVLRWNGKNSSGEPASSGIYFLRLQCNDDVTSTKVTYLK